MEVGIKKNILKWIVLGVLICGFVIIAFFMTQGSIKGFDDFVYNIIAKAISPTMTQVVKVITSFANPANIVIFALIISCIIGIIKKDKKHALLFCLSIVIIALFNFALKNVFTRPRPEYINIIVEKGYSFPSGHSSTGLVFYGYIIYLINKMCDSKKVKVISTTLLSTLILLIGISRIYLGVHFASDVLAAFVYSLAYLILYIYFSEKVIGNNHKK